MIFPRHGFAPTRRYDNGNRMKQAWLPRALMVIYESDLRDALKLE